MNAPDSKVSPVNAAAMTAMTVPEEIEQAMASYPAVRALYDAAVKAHSTCQTMTSMHYVFGLRPAAVGIVDDLRSQLESALGFAPEMRRPSGAATCVPASEEEEADGNVTGAAGLSTGSPEETLIVHEAGAKVPMLLSYFAQPGGLPNG